MLVTDLVSKTIVVATLSHRPPVRLLGGLLRLTELRNPGAAFSIGASSAVMTVLFSLIAVGVIIAIVRTSRRLRSVPWAVTLGLLLGGQPATWGTGSSARPARSGATWWTGYSCRTGRCST